MFGTDGIRGFPYKEPLTKTTIFKIGYSFATYLKKSSSISNIFIAKDTRKSSDYIRKNITEGINCAGISVINLNILPTASISIFTNKYPCLHTKHYKPNKINCLVIISYTES